MNFVGFNVVTFATLTRFCCKVWLMSVQSLSKINLHTAACKQMKLSYITDIVMWSYCEETLNGTENSKTWCKKNQIINIVMWSYYLVHGYAHNFFLFFSRAIFIGPSANFLGTLHTTPNGSTSLDPQLHSSNKCISYNCSFSSLYTWEQNFGQIIWDKIEVVLGTP